MLKINFRVSDYEAITETNGNQLIGGFSSSMSMAAGNEYADETNNCNGGNCVSGCGSGQNQQKCNTVAGCGSL